MSRPWGAEQGGVGDRDTKADPKKGKPHGGSWGLSGALGFPKGPRGEDGLS